MKPTSHLFGCLALLGLFIIEDPFYCSGPAPDHRNLAITYLEQGQYGQALIATRRAIRQDRKDGSLHLIVALAHLGKNEIEEAFAALEQAVLTEPDNPQIHATLRQIFLQEERFDLARDIFESLLQQWPDNGLGQAGLGWAYMHLDNEEKALLMLEQAVAHDDSNLFAHVQLSRIYTRHERMDEAIQVLQSALGKDPDNQQLLLALGEYLLQQHRGEEAERSFKKALHHSDTRAVTATQIAQIYYAQDLRRKAIEYYEQAIDYEPQAHLVLNNLAWTYAEEGIQLDRALQLSLQSLKADTDNVVYLDTYAELLYKKGQYNRAVVLIRQALELEPKDGEHYQYLQEQMQKFRLALEDEGAPSSRL
jgi:tetratricopeptide (TPR) repeat protein